MSQPPRGLVLAIVFLAATAGRWAWASPDASMAPSPGPFFLPTGDGAKLVTVTREGEAEAGLTVVTEAVAVKETSPKAIIDKFGEVYAFSPSFIAVHRDQPTQIEFWNLQPDDEHDFALVFLRVAPWFNNLRGDARFARVAARMQLPDPPR